MIYKTTLHIAKLKIGNPHIKAFLQALAVHWSEKDGRVFSGLKTSTLAEEMEITSRHVRNLANSAVEAGWLEWDKDNNWAFTDKLLGNPSSCPTGKSLGNRSSKLGEAQFLAKGTPVPEEGNLSSHVGEISGHETRTKDSFKDSIKTNTNNTELEEWFKKQNFLPEHWKQAIRDGIVTGDEYKQIVSKSKTKPQIINKLEKTFPDVMLKLDPNYFDDSGMPRYED
jgi:hypothetical protein